MLKYTSSKNALLIAKQYLKQEFRKVFSDVKNDRFYKRLDRSIDNFDKREGEPSFWNLLAAVSEGWKLKQVFSVLSDDKYQWKLKDIPLEKIYLTSLSPVMDKYIVKKFNRDPMTFARAWKANKIMRGEIIKTGFSTHKERDNFPILVYKIGESYRVFDGMRRVLLALINNQLAIKSWVGAKVNTKGKPLISTNRCYFLSNLYNQAKSKDKNLEKAIIRIGKEINKNYRNGKEVLLKRVIGWSHDQKIKSIFAEMIK
ncbi:hypothetical protein A3H66_01010 [Candidatus Falkowbacteria bacterium RIFCSPLOWO2_02_FULL_45_21]|uniref:Uncharacterized protein n=1 Tax=Candidatus Falkowbacteria bacterium RIFCSPLOWO2_02_FULL_45_21 TaxID=1797989 RepID=A0A1F5SBS3_9BACT|nr:MAG: hypothetical protein A3H66_01010 [Candidatus Falkowbacteria bacterium RIFCSPLOWO2_02_FULL_45_21]